MALFERKTFTGHSGGLLHWKIECDALDEADWDALSFMLRSRLLAMRPFPGYRAAVGIPRGGLPLARALNEHCNPQSKVVLLVDDVWTTGGSMRQWRARMDKQIRGMTDVTDAGQDPLPISLREDDVIIGMVAFARSRVDPWVMAAFVSGDQTFA